MPGRPFGELLTDLTQPQERLEAVATRVGGWVRVYQSAIGADGQIDLKTRLQVDQNGRVAVLDFTMAKVRRLFPNLTSGSVS